MWLAIIWLIFAAMFLALGCLQWKMAGKSISHFHISKRPLKQIKGLKVQVKYAGADIDQPLEDFVSAFNSYIDDYNRTSSKGNKAQAMGYWVASATAILSSVLAMFS